MPARTAPRRASRWFPWLRALAIALPLGALAVWLDPWLSGVPRTAPLTARQLLVGAGAWVLFGVVIALLDRAGRRAAAGEPLPTLTRDRSPRA